MKEIEMAHLDLRYAHTRIERPERVLALASSIERFGQILPVIALREGNCFVLLDGYQRVKALKRCGRDTVMAEIWECKEEEALVEILARTHSRKWDLLEEAALLRELKIIPPLPKQDRLHGGTETELGLGAIGSLRCPF